jgi:hypothetical protein
VEFVLGSCTKPQVETQAGNCISKLTQQVELEIKKYNDSEVTDTDTRNGSKQKGLVFR